MNHVKDHEARKTNAAKPPMGHGHEAVDIRPLLVTALCFSRSSTAWQTPAFLARMLRLLVITCTNLQGRVNQ